MTTPSPAPPVRPGRGRISRIVLIAAFLGAVAGLAAIYGMSGLVGNGTPAADAACKETVVTASRLQALARGEVAAFSAAQEPRRLPDLAFADARGNAVKLSDRRGRVILINLWATWCVPCRKEMPALDALQAKLGDEDFEVVAINLDTGDRNKPRKFLDEIGIKHLAYYEDPSTDSFQTLRRYGRAIIGLPATILVDRNGCELGVLPGPAEWASEDALALVRAAKTR
jgi:thiol-disulfide isomerase/thioredoxin